MQLTLPARHGSLGLMNSEQHNASQLILQFKACSTLNGWQQLQWEGEFWSDQSYQREMASLNADLCSPTRRKGIPWLRIRSTRGALKLVGSLLWDTMRWETSQLHYCQKSAMVLQQNLICSHSQGKLCRLCLLYIDARGPRWFDWALGLNTLTSRNAFSNLPPQKPYTAMSEWAPSSVIAERCEEKKRQYEQRIHEVEHATFTPLVMSSTGGMGRAATTFYKRLASMISDKRGVPYGKMVNWIRCRLSFALLRASSCQSGVQDHHDITQHLKLFRDPLTSNQLKVTFNRRTSNFDFIITTPQVERKLELECRW